MKKINQILSVLLVCCLVAGMMPAISVQASDSTTSGAFGENLTWEFDSNSGTLTIDGTGEMPGWAGGDLVPWANYHKLIHNVIMKYGVTNISPGCFENHSGLDTISIPASVTEIGYHAFWGCTSLKQIELPSSIEEIRAGAFQDCENLVSINIPQNVKSIDSTAFENTAYYNDKSNWENGALYLDDWLIAIPNDLSDAYQIKDGTVGICGSVFRGSSISSITVPVGITRIPFYCFAGCANLSSVSLPMGIFEIGPSAFEYCKALKSIVLPEGVVTIGEDAFHMCESLSQIVIPKTVARIGTGSFLYHPDMDIYYAGSENDWNSISIDESDYGSGLLNGENTTITTIHYNSIGPGEDNPEDPSNPEITTSVRFLSGFDSSSRKATFGDSETISLETHTVAEGIDVNQFLNKYVLVTEKQRESSLEYDVTDIQAVDSKIGTVTNTETDGLYLTSMTIDEIKYSVPREKCLSLSSLIDSKVLYHVYSGQVVGFEEIQYKTGRLDKYNQSTNRVTIDGQEYATNYMTDWSFINRFDELEGRRIGYYTGNVLEGKTSRPFLFEIVDSNESSYIKMYATDDDLAISPNDSFDVICTLVRNDQTATQWNKPAVVVGNTDVISLSNYSLDSKGYHFTVTGLKEGNSSLIVSDSETGAHITASISVSKEDIVPYSYRIDKIPEFYPNVTGDKKTKTNFYNLNGMYVKDYAATENKDDGSWDISFKVYNHRYMYGAVDIYDEKGNWKDSEMIEKYTEIGGIYETGEAAVWLVIDGYNGNALSYTAHTWSKCTPIAINVPKGGYFTISNNYLLSPGAYLFNTMDLLVWSASTIVSEGLDLSKSEEVVKKAKEELTTSALVRNEYVKKLQSIGTSVAKNVGQDSAIADQLCSLEDIGEEIFEQTLDWKAIFKNTTSLGESAFEKLMGPIGETMKILFDFSSYLSYGAQTINLGQSINKQYVTIFTPQNSGSMTVNGVTVTPTQEAIDSDTILQVFRISTNDRIVILDNEIVADQYELYNICFVKDDQEIQPNGKVTVRVPVPNGFDGEHCTIYRQEPDGTWSVLSAYVDGDYLVFETDHFSMYVVAQTTFPTSKPTSNPKPTSDPISTPSSNPKPTNNPTSAPTSTPQPTNSPSSNPSPSPNPWKNPFPDVSNTAWYIKAVEYVATEGLMGGYPNGKFGPNNQISRAEFAQIMYNKAGRPNAGTSIFSDVKSGQWYAKAVNWAAEQKVVSGIGNNLFAPERDITREELATMLWRYAESPKPVKTTLDFTDANKVSNFAKEALLWANENGIISGKGNGILDPKGNATRAEAAQMLMNYLKK